MPESDDVDAENIELHGFVVRDPNGPDPAESEAAKRRAVEALGRRSYTMGPDGVLIAQDGL